MLFHFRSNNNRAQCLLQITDNEEDFVACANSDIAQLCAECILFWRRILATASQPSVHALLAKKHHSLRVRRFAEGFFMMENPRGCCDTNYQSYITMSELARRSRYMLLLPPLPVHCNSLDGDSNSLPLIFEDRYRDTPKFSTKHIGSGKMFFITSDTELKTFCFRSSSECHRECFEAILAVQSKQFNVESEW